MNWRDSGEMKYKKKRLKKKMKRKMRLSTALKAGTLNEGGRIRVISFKNVTSRRFSTKP